MQFLQSLERGIHDFALFVDLGLVHQAHAATRVMPLRGLWSVFLRPFWIPLAHFNKLQQVYYTTGRRLTSKYFSVNEISTKTQKKLQIFIFLRFVFILFCFILLVI